MPTEETSYFVVVTQSATQLRQVIEARGQAVAGRDPSSAVVLPHPLVSRRHVQITPQPAGGFEVVDLQSRNGTVLNGDPLAGSRVVSDPAVIEIGPFVLSLSTVVTDETWTAAGASGGRPPRTMLDRGPRQLHIDGTLVLDVLSPHEYALLDLLAGRAPAVVERSAVGDAVWGAGQWDIYMLHNLISRIRKRISQKGAADEVIATVPGVGYRLQ